MIGLQPGMRLVTTRNNTVSGILRVDSVTPSEAFCTVIENRQGVAQGDKVVPLFTLENLEQKLPQRAHPEATILAVFAAGLLAALIGRANAMTSTGPGLNVAAQADAIMYNNNNGANIVSWSRQPGALKYVIYRADEIRWTDVSDLYGE